MIVRQMQIQGVSKGHEYLGQSQALHHSHHLAEQGTQSRRPPPHHPAEQGARSHRRHPPHT